MPRPLVIIESRFWHPIVHFRETYAEYLRHALTHSISLGEAPFASHALYTQVLNDKVPTERQLGIDLAIPFLERCDYVAVYQDYGVSPGMQLGIDRAYDLGKDVKFRFIIPGNG